VAIDSAQRTKVIPELTLSACQWQGQRKRQEDSLLTDLINIEEFGAAATLFAVADGMGGLPGGDQASRLVVSAFATAFEGSSIRDIAARLAMALQAANDAIATAIRRKPKRAGMGTTLLGCCAFVDRLYWVSSGDSLLLLLRDNVVQRLNADHSFGAFKHDPVFSDVLVPDTPDNALVSALTGGRVELVDCPAQGYALRPGDLIVAATDGLETLNDDDVLACLQARPQQFAECLIERVRAYSDERQDNVTVVVVCVNGDGDSDGDEAPSPASEANVQREPPTSRGAGK